MVIPAFKLWQFENVFPDAYEDKACAAHNGAYSSHWPWAVCHCKMNAGALLMKFTFPTPRPFLMLATSVCLSLNAAGATLAPGLWPGRQPDGSMLLPNQWSLRPAGTSIELGNFPVNLALSPDGRFAAILHCGYSRNQVVIVNLADGKTTGHANLSESFYGLTFSHDGRKLYCSGASSELIHTFTFEQGLLSAAGNVPLRRVEEQGVPAGLAIDPADRTIYAANLWNSRISRITLKNKSVNDILLGPKATPVLTVPDNLAEDPDTTAAKKRTRAIMLAITNDPNSLFPYACALDANHDRLYVSLWGDATVAVVDVKKGMVVARWPVGEHPSELALRRDGRFLYVANANDNTVTVLDTQSGRAVENLWATLFPNSPRGATPNSVALSPDEKTLFVANANINAIAVFDVSEPGRGRCLGFIPSGWYPTCVRVTTDGRRLLIVNGKGNLALANPKGPQPVPGQGKKNDEVQYIGSMLKGTLSMVDIPPPPRFARQMAAWTADVLKCTPLRPDASVVMARPADNPIPSQPGGSCPITHCIYVIQENRTYDQVFGDVTEGNGDPHLCLFPARVTPNLHRLAHQFVLLDNFYADAEVSADGHEWSMAAYATDFVEKTWPLNYGHKKSKFPYPSEGVFPIASPASGYLWDRALEAGVSYRSYGEFVQNADLASQPVTTRLKALQGHFDPWFRSFDLEYSDALKVRETLT